MKHIQRSWKWLVVVALVALCAFASIAARAERQRFEIAVASGQTTGTLSLEQGMRGCVRLIAITPSPLDLVTSATYSFSILDPAGAVIFTSTGIADNAVAVLNPENHSGANKFTMGIPVYTQSRETGNWQFKIVANAAVGSASTFAVDFILADL